MKYFTIIYDHLVESLKIHEQATMQGFDYRPSGFFFDSKKGFYNDGLTTQNANQKNSFKEKIKNAGDLEINAFNFQELLNKLSGEILKVRLVASHATATLKDVTPITLAKLICQVHSQRFSKNHQASPYEIAKLTATPKNPAKIPIIANSI